MAIDTALRLVLIELGAAVPPRGLFVETERKGEPDALLDAWAAEALVAPSELRSLANEARN